MAAAAASGVGKFIAGGGVQKVTGFIRGIFGRKRKTAGPVAVATASRPSPLPVASSNIVYGDTPGAGAGKKSFGTWIKENTGLAIGIGVVLLILFGKQFKKLF